MTQLLEPAPVEAPPPLVGGPRPPGFIADRLFRYVAFAAGVLVLVVLVLIIYILLDNSWDWFKAEGIRGIFSTTWAPSENKYGAGALIVMTLMVAAIALIISVPISVGIALFVTEVRTSEGTTADRLHDRPARRHPFGRVRPLDPAPTRVAVGRRLRRRALVLRWCSGPGGHLRRPERLGTRDHDGRPRRRHHDHADHHRDHPRGVRHLPGVTEGGGARDGRDAVGDDSRRGVSAQSQRCCRGRDHRLRPCRR